MKENNMEKYIVQGQAQLTGETEVSGAKNVALKALVAACLTSEKVIIRNIPRISDLFTMVSIIKKLGGQIDIEDHVATIHIPEFSNTKISLEDASHTRTSSMLIAPLLVRASSAIIPNPGGCRLGARPIDRTIEGLKKMGAEIDYDSDDGYFHARADGLRGIEYTFDKNTHTGTETLLIAAVLAKGKTVLTNAALEPEVDELIEMLISMGAKIVRKDGRVIEIDGVSSLSGTDITIKPDRNEIVTFAIGAIVTRGDVFIKGAKHEYLKEFLEKLEDVGGGVEEKADGIRFFYKGPIKAGDVLTTPYPGFMTDWQAPWAVLMTQAEGESIIHEAVFENRFSYIKELKKMGAKSTLFNPPVDNPQEFYNFNLEDDDPEFFHAVKIKGPTKLHNGIVTMSDLRAGATLVIAALAAEGETIIHGVSHVERGYEGFDRRLKSLGAHIEKVNE